MNTPTILDPRTIHATGVTQAGLPVVRIDKLGLFTVREVSSDKSGWCLDARCSSCRWAGCGCECHQEAS